MSRTTQLNISQPQDWVEIFKKQASIEGLNLSEWIGEACKQRCLDACQTTQGAMELAKQFGERPAKGPRPGTTWKQRPKAYLNDGKPAKPTELPPPPPPAMAGEVLQ